MCFKGELCVSQLAEARGFIQGLKLTRYDTTYIFYSHALYI